MALGALKCRNRRNNLWAYVEPGIRPAARVQEKMDMQDNAVSQGGKAICGSLPGQTVLGLQGGGALGSYQAGVYQALHEAGIEPDWMTGTSIRAINASLITGY